MSDKRTKFASLEDAHNLSKVGKSKSPQSLAARMPGSDLVAKVGKINLHQEGGEMRRVIRRNAR